MLTTTACHQLNDERIPAMAVSIDLSNQGIWDTWGVHYPGQHFEFILRNPVREPAGFPYSYGSATGYGGVLLIYGQNSFTGEVGPLAYDLSCPVERMPEITVYVDENSLEAICPDCGSHYNVLEAGGAPTEGPADAMHYAMTQYQCLPTINGGYIITR